MISIVIIVKNDPKIFKLLEKLQQINYPEKHEVIVVDASQNVAKQKYKTYPNVNLNVYPPKKKKTYAEQRNVGVTQAKGDVVVFIDADCIPSKNWLVALLKPIREDNEKIVSGAVRPLHKDYIHIEESYGKYREESETMNLAIQKEVFTKVGYFDEKLEGCEDSDFCIRARKAGFRIRFTKNAYIYHDWGGFLKNFIRSFNGGKDRAILYKKHFKHFAVLSSNNLYTLYYVLYVLLTPLYFFFPLFALILFLPSIVKRRNPIKELFNLSFTAGFMKQTIVEIV